MNAISPYLSLPRRTVTQAVMEMQPPAWIVIWNSEQVHPGDPKRQSADVYRNEEMAREDVREGFPSCDYAYTLVVENGTVRVEIWQ